MRATRVSAIVLAAGRGTRFGGAHKLLADIHGAPVVWHAVSRVCAARVDETVVVLGRDADAVRAALGGLPVRVAFNARYEEGLSTSVHAGLDALGDDVAAAVVALGDQPTVVPVAIDALVARWRAGDGPIVVPVYEGVRGNPVLIDRALFGELRGVRGDEGARALIRRDPARVTRVELPMAAPPDVDTEADLGLVRRLFDAGGGIHQAGGGSCLPGPWPSPPGPESR